MSKKLVLLSGEQTIAFAFLLSIIIAVTISLLRTCIRSIYSIFLLWMESNPLEKSMNNSVVLRFFACTPLMIWWIVRIWSCESISVKTVLIFPKNFLDFKFDMIEKNGIINLSSYNLVILRCSLLSISPFCL